jgi:hypothetical protein
VINNTFLLRLSHSGRIISLFRDEIFLLIRTGVLRSSVLRLFVLAIIFGLLRIPLDIVDSTTIVEIVFVALLSCAGIL